ncbi:hypothetical protein [Sneathiella limimaris]|uniref:hypothetical protein n=1 Tax=Sneathiella limimaris TaxID=1964213 RepID=UPI00146CAB97|nr:hypothetical protein [Sneathiella limimaris]
METETHFTMPQAPDLKALFRQHQEELTSAHQKADQLLQSLRKKDEQTASLVDAYQKEIEQVQLIAKAVVNPPTAMAAVPAVLALANTTSAKAPACDNGLQKMFSECINAIEAHSTTEG